MFTKIIHLHLAKTGGTSINRWLDLLAHANRIAPTHALRRFVQAERRGDSDRSLDHDAARESLKETFGRHARAYWDVIYEHNAGPLSTHPSDYCFVVLREPSSRLLSFLRDWRRLQPHTIARLAWNEVREMQMHALQCTASEFVAAHSSTRAFRKLSQAAALCRVAGPIQARATGDTRRATEFEVARRVLDERFDYVGVFEDLPSVFRCVARDVGAAPPCVVPHANAGRRDPARDTLSPEALALLREAWPDDYALHAHATALAHGFATPDYDEMAFEDGPLAIRLAQLTPWFTGWGRGWSVNDQLVGSGFHGREAPHTAGVNAWTGPGNRSVLYVPVPPNERVDLFLDVAGYIDRRVWASLRVRVDGRETPIVRRPAVGVHERVWCRTATSRPHVKLEILVDRSYSPDELGKGPGDLRKVGLSLRGYGFRVVMPTDRCVEPSANLVEALNAPEGLSSPHPRDH